MSEPKYALFIGGPWDGSRRAIRELIPDFRVAVATAFHTVPPTEVISPTHDWVNYRLVKFSDLVTYVAEYKFDNNPQLSSVQLVLQELARGYRVPL